MTPPIFGRRRNDHRRTYLLANVFELFVAVLAALASLTFFLDPSQLADSAVGRALPPFDYAWNVGYGLGALLVAAGLWKIDGYLEVAGLSLFTAAVLINGIAIIAVGGSVGTIFVYVAFAASCLLRAFMVLKGEHLRMLDTLARKGVRE